MPSFSDNFFKNEIRDGFTISEVMKRSWAADLSALQEIKELCARHSIRFFAMYGTLLGTVREGGYIPWDDDIDIGMLRDDYITFLDAVSKELGDKYEVMNPYTKPWYCMNFSHISNSDDLHFGRAYLKEWQGCPFPVGPDVYPLYYIPRDPAEEQYIMQLLEKVDAAIALCRQSTQQAAEKGFDASAGLNEATARVLVELQHLTGFEFGTNRPLDNQLEILYDQICRLTEPEDADYVARYDEYAKDRSRKFRKEWIENVVELPFEEIRMPVPAAYDAMLKARFGLNYMTPRQERGAHDYPFFKKQLGGLGERLDAGYTEETPVGDRKGTHIGKCSDGRRTVLLHTSVSAMLIYNEYVPEKLRAVLEFFKTHSKGGRLCWLAADFPQTDEMAMDLIAPELIHRYEVILEEYQAAGGELVGGEIGELVAASDCYYGDEGRLAEAFVEAGKRVLVQDYRENASKELCELLDVEAEAADTSENVAAEECTVKEEIRYPEAWNRLLYKSDGRRKKVLLYVNSASTLFQYREQMLEKLKRVLQTFYEKREEVLLVWYPQKAVRCNEEVFAPEVYAAYCDILKEYRDAGWGILEESEDVAEIIGSVDAYYGDADPATELVRKAGKPVMIADCLV